jgi:cytochrome P450
MTDLYSESRRGADELYDPLYHTVQDNLYDVYDVMLRSHPVYYSNQRQVWCLTRYADVQAVAQDWKGFSNLPGVSIVDPTRYGPGDFLDDDPPTHDSLRKVLHPVFLPKEIARLSDDISRRVKTIMTDLRERQTVELAEDFAARLPIWVISRLMGAPEEDDDLIQQLVLTAENQKPGEAATSREASNALAELKCYVADLMIVKRRHPDERVLTILANETRTGVLTEEQAVGMAALIFSAGSVTTYALLGNLLVLLSEHPEALDRLRRDPASGMTVAAIEEALRCETPFQYNARTVKKPVTLHGVEIAPEERIVLVWGAANRDPERWTDPGTFDVTRVKQRHLGFGVGIHHCIGAPLARLEAAIALPAFLNTIASFELGDKRRIQHHEMRGWESLEATLTATL